ncbi:MAG: tetratricopeptide repeat protein [Candidatus Thermoplasmatota archaeon]
MFVGRTEELEDLSSYVLSDTASKPYLVMGEAGIGKTALLDAVISSLPKDTMIHKISTRPFANPMEVVRGLFSALGGGFDIEFGCGFSEVLVLTLSGLLAARAARSQERGIDEDIFAGMLTAVKHFIEDTLGARPGEGGLGRLEYKDMKVLLKHGAGFVLVGIVEGLEHPEMLEEMATVIRRIETAGAERFEQWDGSMAKMADVQRWIEEMASARWPIPRESRGDAPHDLIRISETLAMLALGAKERALIVVEDLHWLSKDQADVLAHLARTVPDTKIKLLCSARPFDSQLLDPFTVLRLHPLPHAEVEGIARSALGDVDEALLTEMTRLSGGNPLFLSELVKLGRNFDASAGTSLAHVISERVHVLEPDVLRACEFAAAQGHSFDIDLLDAVLDQNTAALLAGVDFISVEGGRSSFVHALYHSAVYDSISQYWRSHIHSALSEKIIAMGITDLFAVARHMLLGGRDERCIAYGLRAGRMSSEGYDHELAFWYYNEALQRCGRFRAAEVVRAELVDGCVGSLIALGNTSEAKALMERHLQSLSGPWFGRLLTSAARVEWILGNYEDAKTWAKKAMEHRLSAREKMEALSVLLDVAVKQGDPRWAVEYGEAFRGDLSSDPEAIVGLLLNLSKAHEAMGNYAKVGEILSEAMKIASNAGEIVLLTKVENSEGILLYRSGRLEEAREMLTRALEHARAARMLRLEVQALLNIANVHQDRRELDAALQMYQEVLGIARRGGYKDAEAMALANIGHNLAYQEKYEESTRNLEMAAEIFEKAGNLFHVTYAFWSIAENHALTGRKEEGVRIAQRALDLSVKSGSQINEAYSWYIIGLVHGECGDVNAAQEALRLAIARYEEMGSASERAMIHGYWAELEAKIGDREIAEREKARAVKLYLSEGLGEKADALEQKVKEALGKRNKGTER